MRVVPVGTAEELRTAMLAESAGADVVVMSAAVADFRPEHEAASQDQEGQRRRAGAVPLVRNPDVLAELVTQGAARPARGRLRRRDRRRRRRRADHARAKLARKGCDLLVVNDVSAGKVFGREDNAVVVLAADGEVSEVPPAARTTSRGGGDLDGVALRLAGASAG